MWAGFSLALMSEGCGAPRSIVAAPVGRRDPAWILVRVDAVRVAPFHPHSKMTWDGPAPAPNDGAECGLLGLGLGVINPVLGTGANYLCQIDTRSPQREQDPSAPDLAVLVSAGMGATYMTYTAPDTFYHVFRREFVVPTGAIPPEGLSFTVIDQDRPRWEVIGSRRVSRQELIDTAFSPQPVLVLSDPAGGLERLELVVSPYGQENDGVQVTMDARDGTIPVSMRSIPAGSVVTIGARGHYQIGSYYDAWLDPRGYPGGGPREYNFETEPFRSAPHGSALAILGHGDAKEGVVVAPCTSMVSKVGGRVVVGVNDKEPRNNTGQLQFSIGVRPPSPAEWMSQRTNPCGSW